MTVLGRLLPAQIDNKHAGHPAALWLLGLFVALKLLMSVNSLLNTEAVAVGADGFPLDTFGPAAARAVLMLFALLSLDQLVLGLVAVTALARYRAMIPLVYLMLVAEHLARRFIVSSYAVPRTGTSPIGWYVNLGLLALLIVGLVLSLIPRRREAA
ncbi:MAG: hypothetical protein AMXMBFR53_23100 [Gemmatimonadota bacterium]